MDAHEQQCQFRLYKCFAAKCAWSGTAYKILNHMESNHKERVFLGFEKVFKVKKLENRDDLDMMFIFSCWNAEFWVKFIYRKVDTSFFGAVQYIGQADMACKFTYCFEIKTSDHESERQYRFTRLAHSDETDFETIFKSRDCFWAPISIAKYFAESDVLSIKVNIDSTAQH